MNAVFVGGSRRLSRLNPELARRFDNIIRREFRVLVGDANGFDRAAQTYLAEHAYGSVVVYCTAGECRNNVGNWPIRAVEYNGRDRGRPFYTAKDDAMLNDADYGLFGWDGKSEGTLRNIRKMAELRKPSAVYLSRGKMSLTVSNLADFEALTGDFADDRDRSQMVDLFSDSWSVPIEQIST
jgi:hypothetical protein